MSLHHHFAGKKTFFLSKKTGLVVLLSVLMLPWWTACQKKSGDAPDLIILQTGRLRGNVIPSGVKNTGDLQHFPYIAGYIKKVREEARATNTPVLVVDLGDSLTGTFSSAVTKSANVVTFFNQLQYDAVMLGNLDADVQPETIKTLKMPVLTPFQGPGGEPAMPGAQFTTTIKKGGIEVELLANFYGDTRQEEFPERFPSVFGPTEDVLPFRDYKKSTGENDNRLRLFAWMKFEHEGTGAPALLEDLRKLGVGGVLAHRVYGREKTDAWTSSSTYNWELPVSLNILRSNRGFALARADFKRIDGRWVMQKQKILPMVSNTAPADQQIERDIQRYAKSITDAEKLIATAEKSVSPEVILEHYLAALTTVPDTQVAIYSPQSVRAGWARGPIHSADIYASLPWAKGLVQFDLTPEQLLDLHKDKNLRILTAPGLTAGSPRTVTTSDFFARVIARGFGLDRSQLREVVKEPEYVFFSNYLLKKADPSQNYQPPAGWTLSAKP